MTVLRRLARRSLPQVDGRLSLDSLEAPVEVIRDRYGIPHIYAGSRRDLARAQGYVHGQDRLFQMELTRRFAFGRLAEIAGGRALEIDRVARRLRLRWSAERDADACDDETREIVEAYCEGVNAAIARGPLPLEFRLLRFRPEPWTPLDVQAPGQMFAVALSGNWEVELAQGASPARERAGVGASNAFAVAGHRTASGRPLLANDPHLLLAVPGIWHAQHLVWDGGEAWGFTVAGAPVVILGRNRRVAWGMTTAMIDTQDLFRVDDVEDAAVVREEIRVRGRREPAVEEVVVTRYGPIVEPGLALRWSAHEAGETTRGILDLMTAGSVEEADTALDRFAGPPHNLVLADAAGEIGLRVSGGPIPVRAAGDGTAPAPGDGSHDWTGWIAQEDLPRVMNPEKGYVVSANDEVAAEIPGEYLSDYRARRIEALLEGAGGLLTAEACRRIMLDRLSLPGLELAAAAREFDPSTDLEAAALDVLASWDGHYGPDSAGGAVYGALMLALEEEVWGKDAPAATSERGRPGLIRALASGDESFLPDGRTWEDVTQVALERAVRRLGPDRSLWRRSRLHRLRFAHALDTIPSLRHLLGRGPFGVGGDADTVHVLAPVGVAEGSMIGPSMRAVYDLAEPDSTLVSLAPGQSGHPASPHYDDLLRGWLRGELFPLATERGQVEELAEATLVLEPE